MAIEWTPVLAVGVEDIDAQHRELFARADRLVEAMGRGAPRDEVAELLGFLTAYTVWHFGLEEAWMQDAGYPALAPHRAEHARFVDDLTQLAGALSPGASDPGLAARLSDWLGRWLEAHVAGTDTEMGRFLQRRAGVTA